MTTFPWRPATRDDGGSPAYLSAVLTDAVAQAIEEERTRAPPRRPRWSAASAHPQRRRDPKAVTPSGRRRTR
jgi:hypothetical protein